MVRHIGKYSFISLFFILSCISKQEEVNRTRTVKVVEAKGYVVPQDSLAQPRVIAIEEHKLRKIKPERPKIVPAHMNVYPAGTPELHQPGNPRLYTPGQDTFALPVRQPILDSPYVAGMPEVIVAKDMISREQNPCSFSFFSRLQGLKNAIILTMSEDKEANLWVATNGGGVTKYNGQSFTTYTTREGLSHNTVNCILNDREGNIWFGTFGSGICKYDGKYFTNYTLKEGAAFDNTITCMTQDASGNLWIGTWGGLAKYDAASFTYYSTREGLSSNDISSLMTDRAGNIWIGTWGGGVNKFDGQSFTRITTAEGLSLDYVACTLEDQKGNIWIGTSGGGINKFDGHSLSWYTEKEGLSSNSVGRMLEDHHGDLWICTSDRGINKFDGTTFTRFTEKEGLPSNAGKCILEDRYGTLWIGTAAGLVKYDGNVFLHYTEKEGLTSNELGSILIDEASPKQNKSIWIGTEDGYICHFDGTSFTRFTQKDGYFGNPVYSLIKDEADNLWVGTWGAGVFRFDGKWWTHFSSTEGLPYNEILNIAKDKKGNLWISTQGGGVTRYDGFSFTTYGTKEGLSNDVIFKTLEDRKGNLWFATMGGGVTRFDGHSFTHFRFVPPGDLSNDIVVTLMEAQNGNIWFGTFGNGAILYQQPDAPDGDTNSPTGRFIYFTENEGLSSNYVSNILEDQNRNIWFGTRFGLSKLTPEKLTEFLTKVKTNMVQEGDVFFKNFGYEDGFLGIGCSKNIMGEDRDGVIWVGTNDRLTALQPGAAEADKDTIAPAVQLTGIQLFNEPIPWAELESHKDSVLTLGNGIRLRHFAFSGVKHWYNIPENLSLAYNNNFLTFDFIGITQNQPKQVRYQYKLEGFDENWSAITARSEAPYGNLAYGKYTFKVKAMNAMGYWSNEYQYSFTVRPPWWHTWWFRIMLGLTMAGSTGYYIQWRERALKQKQKELELEVQEATRELIIQREEALQQKHKAETSEKFKQQFLANMSHEIRTPMNAVLGMTSLVLDTPLQDRQKFYLDRIKKSGDTLLHIINDILDLSKIEAGKMELEKIDFSIRDTVDQVKQTLQHRADEKGLDLLTSIDPSIEDIVLGDPVRLNQILINLAGNAIKFTEKGSVYLKVTKTAEPVLKFSVIDTGIGIPKDKLESVFENFSQANIADSRKYGGTGLGLSISRQLVGLMGGRITVESEEGVGSVFSFTLALEPGSAQRLKDRQAAEKNVAGVILDGLRILVVDDNEYNRIVARDTLASKSKAIVKSADSAFEAFELLRTEAFDVILMDVQMPGMNGLDATRHIRANFAAPVNHIPVIALTASVLRTDLDKCREAGMNAYIPKPFKASQLILGIADVLNLELNTGTPPTATLPEGKDHPVNMAGITDLGYLTTFCEGDEEKMRKYIGMFTSTAPVLMDRLQAAVKAGDWEDIAGQVHAFKTKWIMMGMSVTKEVAMELENACREKREAGYLEDLVRALIRQIEQALEELANQKAIFTQPKQ